jgi:hypothetical protein
MTVQRARVARDWILIAVGGVFGICALALNDSPVAIPFGFFGVLFFIRGLVDLDKSKSWPF